jgi:Tol biopolymer transport system component
MHRRLTILILIFLILVLAGGSAYLLGTPRLVSIQPEPGATQVPAGASLQLTFSRPMSAVSLADKLSIQPPQKGAYTWDGSLLTFTPERPWPNGEIVRFSLAGGIRAAGWLSLPTRQQRHWSMTIEKPLLIYLYPANNPAAIYAINPGSGDASRLTDIPGEVFDFSVDSSGTTVVYSAGRNTSGSTLYRLNRLTGENSIIMDFPAAQCRYPQVSPDGAFVAYERTGLAAGGQANPSQVWLLPLADDQGSPAPPVPFAAGAYGHQNQQPFWSPGGLLTYYDATLSAFILYDPRTRQSESVPSQTGQAGVWDPTGRWYVFPEILAAISPESADNTGLSPLPTSHLMRYDRVDKRLQDLTIMDNLEDTSPAFSPDGKTLVFARKYLNLSDWTPGRQIWLMDPDGSHAHQILQEPQYNHYDFSWSPDGAQIAYVRFDQTLLTAPPEVWIIQADGSLPRKLVAAGYAPRWIP